MSFRDLDDEGQLSNATTCFVSLDSNHDNDTTLAVQKAITTFEEKEALVGRAVSILGTNEDSAAHRQTLQRGVDAAMDAANDTTEALQLMLMQCNSVKSVSENKRNSSVKRVLHRKLNNDFERALENLNKNVQKVLNIPLPPQVSTIHSRSNQGNENEKPTMDNDVTEHLLQSTVEMNQTNLDEREREFRAMKRSVLQLNDIYNSVSIFINRQGDDIENIENQTSRASERTNAGLGELLKSSVYRRRINPFTVCCFILIILGVIVVVILLATRKSHSTSYEY